MKKLALLICLVLCISLIALSCATTTQTTTVKPIEIIIASPNPAPEIYTGSAAQLEWSNGVEKATGGRVKFIYYYSSTLLAPPEMLKGTQDGVADIGLWVPGVVPGLTPLSEFGRLPFLGWTSLPQMQSVYGKIFNSPTFSNEYKGVKVLGGHPMGAYQIHTNNKLLRTPADLKGVKLAAEGPLLNFFGAAGGTPVDVSFMDWYVSIERRVVDGLVNSYSTILVTKVSDLTKCHTVMGDYFCNAPMVYVMNQAKWDSLPPDIQKILENSMPAFLDGQVKAIYGNCAAAEKLMKDRGDQFADLSAEEMKLWQAYAAPVVEGWLKEYEAKGYPARAALDEVKKLMEQYK